MCWWRHVRLPNLACRPHEQRGGVLEVMDSVGVLRIVRIENDTKAKSAGEKLFFADPALYSALNGDLGTARKYKIEVGVHSKKPKQADFVIRDDTDYPAGNAIPLWLLGFA